MNDKERQQELERYGSGKPGNQGTFSGVGAQPDGGGAGLGEQVKSGTGSPQDIAESQPTPPED